MAKGKKELFDISKLRINPENPFPFKSDKERSDLIAKIDRDKEFLSLRGIVYDSDDNYLVLGGNKRLEAIRALGFTEVPKEWVKDAAGLSDEKKRRFIFADNWSAGEWDMNYVTEEEAEEWDIDIQEEEEEIDYSQKNKEIDVDDFDDEMTIKLKYSKEEYHKVREGLAKIGHTPELAVWKLLGYE